jgi:catechol 2,3-dioxygenase-like lactoylglutathione lyase family enzyme
MIKEIAFIVYPVADMTRARRFYEETLGLKLETNWEDQWIEYDIRGSTFAISTMDEKHRPGSNGGLIAFEVDDFDAEVARLKGLQVSFVADVVSGSVCRTAVVADPDGNHIIIHKRHA